MQSLKPVSLILTLLLCLQGFGQDFPTGSESAFPQTIQQAQDPAVQNLDDLSGNGGGTSTFEQNNLYAENGGGYTTFDDPPGEPGDPGDPVDNVPLDGGLAFLLAAGIGISLRRFAKQTKNAGQVIYLQPFKWLCKRAASLGLSLLFQKNKLAILPVQKASADLKRNF